MDYSTDIPICGTKNGEERYFIFLTDFDSFSEHDITFCKVKCLKRRYDKVNETHVIDALVLEEYFKEGKVGKYTTIDHNWQLQKTRSAAQRLLIILAMHYYENLSYKDKIPI